MPEKKRRTWPDGFGKRAAELHNGGPQYGGLSWSEVAEILAAEFGIGVDKWNARDTGRSFLRSEGCVRYGVPKGADESGVEVREHDNYLEVTYTPSGRPRVYTYEQLVALANVDFDVWAKETFEVTFWEQGYKDERAKLEYVDGKATGFIEKDGGKVEQLCRIFARFVKRRPEPVRPSIQPVKADKVYPFPAPRQIRKGLTRTLSYGDLHCGFLRDRDFPMKLVPLHDRRALSICLQFAEEQQPDHIIIGGDVFDFAEMSKYITSPEYRFLLQPAIYELHWHLAQLRRVCPSAEIVILEGNHDERMWRHQKQHSDWACDLKKATASEGPPVLSVQNLLDLDSLGIRWVGDYPNGEYWVDNIRFIHGDIVRAKPGATAGAVVDGADWSTVFFHIHRAEEANRTVWGKRKAREIFAVCPAGVCRIDGKVPARTNRENWQQGLLLADIYEGDYPPDKHIVRIYDGVANFRGVTYEGVESSPPVVQEWGG